MIGIIDLTRPGMKLKKQLAELGEQQKSLNAQLAKATLPAERHKLYEKLKDNQFANKTIRRELARRKAAITDTNASKDT